MDNNNDVEGEEGLVTEEITGSTKNTLVGENSNNKSSYNFCPPILFFFVWVIVLLSPGFFAGFLLEFDLSSFVFLAIPFLSFFLVFVVLHKWWLRLITIFIGMEIPIWIIVFTQGAGDAWIFPGYSGGPYVVLLAVTMIFEILLKKIRSLSAVAYIFISIIICLASITYTYNKVVPILNTAQSNQTVEDVLESGLENVSGQDCLNIDGWPKRNTCIRELVKAGGDPELCIHITHPMYPEEDRQLQCFIEAKVQLSAEKICSHFDDSFSPTCFEKLALDRLDSSLCFQIPEEIPYGTDQDPFLPFIDKKRDHCLMETGFIRETNQVFRDADLLKCQYFVNKDACSAEVLMDMATIIHKDTQYCVDIIDLDVELVTGEELRDNRFATCIKNSASNTMTLAEKTRDIGVCEKALAANPDMGIQVGGYTGVDHCAEKVFQAHVSYLTLNNLAPDRVEVIRECEMMSHIANTYSPVTEEVWKLPDLCSSVAVE